MPTYVSPENIDKAFALLVDHAIIGARCPVTSGPHAHPLLVSAAVSKLCREGRIFVEISGHNWRQVTILTGPHAGKKTAPNPVPKACIYRVVDHNGTRLTRAPRNIPHASQPSALPRF